MTAYARGLNPADEVSFFAIGISRACLMHLTFIILIEMLEAARHRNCILYLVPLQICTLSTDVTWFELSMFIFVLISNEICQSKQVFQLIVLFIILGVLVENESLLRYDDFMWVRSGSLRIRSIILCCTYRDKSQCCYSTFESHLLCYTHNFKLLTKCNLNNQLTYPRLWGFGVLGFWGFG